MEKFTVSGCIVTHNNMRTIKNTLDSIFEYTEKYDFKLFVVDNLSTDGTPEFIRENYPQIELIEPRTNHGFGAGHNLVLPLIDSDYHMVINPDIIIRDDVVEKLVDRMERDTDKKIGLISPKICFPDGRLQILGKRYPKIKYLVASRLRNNDNPGKILREYARLDENQDCEYTVESATGCFMFFRTEVFKKVNGFDERYFMYFEDNDISREINRFSLVLYYPGAVIYHVWGRDSKKSKKLMIIQIQSMFKFFIKWFGK